MYKKLLNEFINRERKDLELFTKDEENGKCGIEVMLEGKILMRQWHDESELPINNREGHDIMYKRILFTLANAGVSYLNRHNF